MQRFSRAYVGIVGRQVRADVKAFLQVRPIARVDRLMHWCVAAIILVDAGLQPCFERETEKHLSRRESTRDDGCWKTMIDELERAPRPECGLEIARNRLVGVRVSGGNWG